MRVELPHVVIAENAPKIWEWLQNRGGIIVWMSHGLGNPGASVTTPFTKEDGSPQTRPGWQYPEPSIHITEPSKVVVETVKHLETIPVKLKREGMRLIVTDGSRRKMDRLVAKHKKQHPGKEVWWTPTGDLMAHEAVILMAESRVPIRDFMAG